MLSVIRLLKCIAWKYKPLRGLSHLWSAQLIWRNFTYPRVESTLEVGVYGLLNGLRFLKVEELKGKFGRIDYFILLFPKCLQGDKTIKLLLLRNTFAYHLIVPTVAPCDQYFRLCSCPHWNERHWSNFNIYVSKILLTACSSCICLIKY